MTGPEHYLRAAQALQASLTPGSDADAAERQIARAHAHATLALVAATVEQRFDPRPAIRAEWREALELGSNQ